MEASKQTFSQLLEEKSFLNVPKKGDIVKGAIVAITKNEVKIDIPGFRTGVVRGPELKDESGMYETLKVGDPVEATVIGAENENGDMELSFRFAGHLRAWETLHEIMQKREKIAPSRSSGVNSPVMRDKASWAKRNSSAQSSIRRS